MLTSTSPPQPARDATTVDRLMEAAAHAFAEKGFHATTTRDIASGAGLSPAGVYVHFGSKEDLLFNLSRSGHQSALQLLRDALEGVEGSAERLAVAMNRFSAWHAEQYQLAKVVQYEHQHLTPEHRAVVLGLRKDIDAQIRQVLERGVAAGDFHVDDIGDTALALLSMAVDVARWYSPTIKRTPQEIGETNAALALRLVGAGHP
ncbi:TetR/AcrR family transcriptional regulator [Intrasporangium calvum]|uniref:Transcriptional regulator, TetR family n=1 Tax=Intrasporangium calvum (strain ATCC 23552 / DSM 43043 / JCM 3097 / NBRC 12989 / NCIMB 10167 / NRRL B-3866 / 7 KIP) TaxID=710696 RepID=E6S6B1_INTC7|nr:TetR/AcrR family transcriptional regulator [Intrasporangium calvum]ADU47862.1 transcriptional regulator, TetR family [Intrasporangium calvum DSM 43043]